MYMPDPNPRGGTSFIVSLILMHAGNISRSKPKAKSALQHRRSSHLLPPPLPTLHRQSVEAIRREAESPAITTPQLIPVHSTAAFFLHFYSTQKSLSSDQIRSSARLALPCRKIHPNHGPLPRSRGPRRHHHHHQGAVHQRQRHGRRPEGQGPGAERADPLLDHAPLRRRPPVARPGDRPGGADHLQLRDRDPQGEQGEVRAGQEDGAHQGGPGALLLRRLPAQLRLHPAHPLRRLRPHRRPRHHAGARRPRLLPQGKGHRPHAHDRPGRGRRQDHRRLRRRPRVPPLQRHQGAAPASPRRDQKILRGLQEEREQGGGCQRLPAIRGRLRSHPALNGSLCHLHLRGPEKVDDRSGDAMPLAGGC